MYTEDEPLPLSALQHLHFCKRQCALIHVERVWVENLYTVEGRIMHERADSGLKESRGSLRVECSAGAWIETAVFRAVRTALIVAPPC